LTPTIDRGRTVRGATCGAIAAGVWALEQPLDKSLFACRFDDVELLGKAFTRGEAWLPAGLVLHAQNGALFGAVYANLAPRLPIPPATRGPLIALIEHLMTWPLTTLTDRHHPARAELPRLSGNARAFAQATWRHLLFGLVLGELERRLNPPVAAVEDEAEATFSSNGHGSLETAVSVEGAP
jgi:hypothetical protein